MHVLCIFRHGVCLEISRMFYPKNQPKFGPYDPINQPLDQTSMFCALCRLIVLRFVNTRTR